MNELIEHPTTRQFVKFAIVGVISTLIDWGAFYLFNHFLGVFYLIAKILSFILAVINSYLWNRSWTFRSQNKDKIEEFGKFIVVSLVGLGINTLIFYLAAGRLHLTYILSLIIATAITLVWNFLANKSWVFKK